MTAKTQQARDLYLNSGKTQKEIAAEVGVSERTIQYWAKQNQWQRLREAAFHMPAIISDNLCMQIVELQNDIASREPGKRYPTIQEAEILRKLINSMERMKRYPSLAIFQQVFKTFRDYTRDDNKDFSWEFACYEERFLTARAINGFHPWEMEYGAQHTIPLDQLPETDSLEEEHENTEEEIKADTPAADSTLRSPHPVSPSDIHKTDLHPQSATDTQTPPNNIDNQTGESALPIPHSPQ